MVQAAAQTHIRDPLADLVDTTKAIGDRLRAQILRALSTESYSVSELCHIFDMPQPALSHHLKVLRIRRVWWQNAGKVTAFTTGVVPNPTISFAVPCSMPLITPNCPRFWAAGQLRCTPTGTARVLLFSLQTPTALPISRRSSARPTSTPKAFAEIVGHFPINDGTLLEIGPGTGEVLEQLAVQFRKLVGIDSSQTMLQQASKRVSRLPNVQLKQRDFFALPALRKYRAVVAAMVLHHMPSPQRFFSQAHHVVKADGLLVIAELCQHDHDWVIEACGDTWLGFEAMELATWATKAGFVPVESQFLGQKNGFQIQIHGYQPTANYP